LGERIPLIVDGGQSQVGIESTVIDIAQTPPWLLRPGMIHEESLLAVTGELITGMEAHGKVLRSPGQLKKHYSPKARLLVLEWRSELEFEQRLATALRERSLNIAPEAIAVIAHSHIPLRAHVGRVSVIPHDAEAFARAIYSELHACDAAQTQLIVVEAVPPTAEWRAIADRLNRAAAQE
jgi:L-threonylcarbamoyladenylate synthase